MIPTSLMSFGSSGKPNSPLLRPPPGNWPKLKESVGLLNEKLCSNVTTLAIRPSTGPLKIPSRSRAFPKGCSGPCTKVRETWFGANSAWSTGQNPVVVVWLILTFFSWKETSRSKCQSRDSFSGQSVLGSEHTETVSLHFDFSTAGDNLILRYESSYIEGVFVPTHGAVTWRPQEVGFLG